jgi:ferric-dicitrate binding protein FerR (iron transport regulator)
MDCRRAQELSLELLLQERALSRRDRAALSGHMMTCTECREVVGRLSRTLEAIRQLPRPLLERALRGERIGTPVQKVQAFPIAARSSTCPPGSRRIIRAFVGIGALAACLGLVVCGLRLAMLQPSTDQPGGRDEVRAASGQMGTVVIEGDTREWPLLAGDSVSSRDGRRREIRVWGRHRLGLEPSGQLAVHQSESGGCVVALAEGHIGVSVRRAEGEGLFRVVTPKADVTVTGTVFEVGATQEHTQLVVREGAVQFVSRAGQVRAVAAGQAYATDGTVLCAVGFPDNRQPMLAIATGLADRAASIRTSPWYKERFAPLLALRDGLVARKVAVDERTLLAISGDLWCLQYHKTAAAAASGAFRHRRAGLERAARLHGYRVEWIEGVDAVGAAEMVREANAAGDFVLAYGWQGQHCRVLGEDQLEQWQAAGSPGWSYRFFGETESAANVMCRISRPPYAADVIPAPEQLAAEAAAELEFLFNEARDAEMFVGREALAEWSDHFARGEDLSLDDPLVRAVHLLAGEGTDAIERLSGMTPLPSAGRWCDLFRALDAQAEAAFTALVFDRTACGRMERLGWARTFRERVGLPPAE